MIPKITWTSNWYPHLDPERLLVGGFNPSDNISQIGSFPLLGMNIKYFLEPPPRLPWQWEKQSFEDATPSKNWELDKIIQPIEKPAISRGNTSSNPSSLCSSNWLRMQLLRWPNMTTECTESTCRTTYLKLNLKNHMSINSKSTSIPLSDWNKPCNHQLHWTSKFKMSQPFWSHFFFPIPRPLPDPR